MHVSEEDETRQALTATSGGFGRLLDWLDDGVDSHGERYLEMHRRLAAYFDRRNRLAPDDLADDTLNRVAKTLEETGAIMVRPPARYCYVVARYVLLEDIRRERRMIQLDDAPPAVAAPSAVVAALEDGLDPEEDRLARLDRCLQNLDPGQRELVVEYYRDAGRERIEHRRRMAARMGISMNALGIRAYRLREALMNCVRFPSGASTNRRRPADAARSAAVSRLPQATPDR